MRLSPSNNLFLCGATPPLAFVLGVCLLQNMPFLPPPGYGLALIFPTAAALFYAPKYKKPLLVLLMLLCGFFTAAWRAEDRLKPVLPESLIWKDITVEMQVQGAVKTFDGERTSFSARLIRVVEPVQLTLSGRARISDYHRDAAPLPQITNGAVLRVRVRLRPPEHFVNPFGFDFGAYSLAQNIRLRGYLRQRDTVRVIGGAAQTPRDRLHQRLQNSGAPQTPLLAALLVGDRRAIEDDAWRILRRTGTAHLVSVSGTHIGFVFFMAAMAAGLLWRFSRRLTGRMPSAKAALLLSLPAALAYAWLAGFGVPVQRSFIMAALAALVVLHGRILSAPSLLALAMMTIVLFDPWVVLLAGFWLSCLLTGAIVFITLARPGRMPAWRRLLLMQLYVSMGAVPLTLWFFNEASLISPLANLIAVPAVGLFILPLTLAGIVVGDPAWHAAGHLMEALRLVLQFLSDLPYASWSPAQAPVGVFILALFGAIWLFMPRGVPLRAVGIIPIIAILLWTPSPPADGAVRVTVLDVGQGNAVVVQTARHTLVYDVGRALGGRIIADYLRGVGVRRLDALMISHEDYDHNGGLANLREHFVAERHITNHDDDACRRGQRWQWDNVSFFIHHPTHRRAPNRNDNSCVLEIRTAAGAGILLTGDISQIVENTLAATLKPLTVLLVSHHGSGSSSSSAFLNALQPDLAVISSGRNNYGHPHPRTMERLKRIGADILRTDRDGALIIELDEAATVTAWRKENKRYWRH